MWKLYGCFRRLNANFPHYGAVDDSHIELFTGEAVACNAHGGDKVGVLDKPHHGMLKPRLVVRLNKVTVNPFFHGISATGHSSGNNRAPSSKGLLGASGHSLSIVGGQYKHAAFRQPRSYIINWPRPNYCAFSHKLLKLGFVDGTWFVVWCSYQNKFNTRVLFSYGFGGIYKITHAFFREQAPNKYEPYGVGYWGPEWVPVHAHAYAS